MSGRITKILKFASWFGLAWLGLAYLTWPFGRDQGIFAWVGDTILRGGVPYKDAWDVKGPATHLLFALSQALFGRNPWGLRLLDLGLLALCLFSMRRIVRLLGDRPSWWGAALFLGLYLGGNYWNTGQPDGWAAMLLIVSLGVALTPAFPERPRLQILVGAILGVIFLLKTIFALLAVPIGFYLILQKPRRPGRVLGSAAILIGSFCLPLVAILSWFAMHGALGDFIQEQVAFNLGVHTAAHAWTLADQAKRMMELMLGNPASVIGLPFLAFGLLDLRRRNRAACTLLIGEMFICVLMAPLQNKYYYYHWIPFLALECLAVGWGVSRALSLARRAAARPNDVPIASMLTWLTRFAIVPALMIAFLNPALQAVRLVAKETGLIDRDHYLKIYGEYGKGDFSYRADVMAAQYLETHSGPGDTALVWGFEPIINYLAGRRSPTRFGFHYPLTRGAQNPFEVSYRREFMEKLAQGPPLYILVVDFDQNNLQPLSSKELLQQFVELKNFVEKNYRLETVIEHFEIWRRSRER